MSDMSQRTTFSDDRSFVNTLKDYGEGTDDNIDYRDCKVKLSSSFFINVQQATSKLYNKLERNLLYAFASGDKIYTGVGGLVLLQLLNEERKRVDSKAPREAIPIILKAAEECPVNGRISFLTGNVGIVTLAILHHHLRGDQSKVSAGIEKLIRFSQYCFASGSLSPCDELLYGRAGYLYALLLIRKRVPNELLKDSLIKEVAEKIIDSGRNLANCTKAKTPLQYEWHDKEYIGAAHGYCGILHTLLLAYREGIISKTTVNTYIKPTIDYVLEMQYPSKNLPSSVNSLGGDKLVQWCHGAPGAIHMVALAYQVLKDEKYLQTAIELGEVTWQRGLLRKGYSLCHGVAGNGYAFLRLYKLTRDVKYLHRAIKFAEWCYQYGSKQTCKPDRPYSLFEGLVGVIYFFVDLQCPTVAKFPGVEI